MERVPGSLAERLNSARDRAFVGRSAELGRFGAALRQEPGAGAVLYVHGPGGVGKSALLRRFADEARDAGRIVVEVDGRLIDPSPLGFEAEAAKAAGADPGDELVLLVDAFERCQGLEGWLRDRFLPHLPERAVVVIAGRLPPSTAWTVDLAWSEALEILPLAPLDPAASAALLERRGVAPALHQPVLSFTGGHPLALTLAASVAVSDAGPQATWEPTPDVIAALLTALIGELPSPTHRTALETAAHTMTTTEGLLKAVIGEQGAAEMFTWLRGLPFAQYGRHGLFLHDLVREILDRDLRWRDPQGYEQMHRRAGHHLLAQVRTSSGADVMSALRALTYLKRYGPMTPYFQDLDQEGDVYEDSLRPEDHETLVRMAREVEGERSARFVRHWLAHQPSAFMVYRRTDTGETVAFMTWLRMTARSEEAEADPVVAAAWDHVERSAPLRPGEHFLLARFMVDPVTYGGISHVGHLMQLRICVDWIRSQGLGWSFILSSDAALWTPLMSHLGHRQVFETPWDRGRVFTAFACDWRVTPLEIWFDRTQPGALSDPSVLPAADRPDEAALTRADFDRAVRDALRALHHPDDLRSNPLLSSRTVAVEAEYGNSDPVDALRRLLTETVEALLDEPRAVKAHRAVATTFLERPRTQEASAQRLGIPYSTYRRHLAQGMERVCELLWRRERSGAPAE
ncbi:ATP-binding protein [Streptomyces sp. NPDC059862]|uniref:ATP-binding protein n=1 Tax=Streptomyces sp. NPDC059862 TaxID=3346975 RepID=UPI00366303FF